jgi:hypothetical protein
VFLLLLFRIAGGLPTRKERWASAEVGRKLIIFVWLPALILQPLFGFGMIYARTFALDSAIYYDRWLALSLTLYVAAFLSWASGFHCALKAARADTDDDVVGTSTNNSNIANSMAKRDMFLGVALACTLVIYCLMIYHEQFEKLFLNLAGQ